MAAQTTQMKIVVDDGSVKIPIENAIGQELGFFIFRPTDVGILQRYNDAISRMESIVEPLNKSQIKSDGTADETVEGSLEALHEAEKVLYEVCDYILDGNMSEAFFGKRNPFTPIGGRFYFEIAIETLGKFISAQFNAETKKISRKVDKYTSKYIAAKK